MKDAIMNLISAIFAADKQLIVDAFAALLDDIFAIVKVNM